MDRLAQQYRAASLATRVIALGSLAIGAAITGWLGIYLFSVAPPFGFEKDLGSNIVLTSFGVAMLHSWSDFFASIGWRPLEDSPSFFQSGYLSYSILVPIAKIIGAWQAIKVVQALQIVVGVFGIAWLVSYPKKISWGGLAAGLTYIIVPSVALSLRWNIDLGWTWVLPPLTLASCRHLLEKHAARALPLCGVLCAAAGVCVHIEFLFFSSIPLFAIVIAYAFAIRQERSVTKYLAWSAAGGLALALTGSWFLLPTFIHPFLSDAGTRVAQLTSGAILAQFSQTIPSAVGLLQREFTASPFPQYNATNAAWVAFIGGAIICLGAALYLFSVAKQRGWRRPDHIFEATLVGIGLICAILSMGPNIPFGDALWKVIALVPHLDAIRTPDRFIELPIIAVVVLFFLGLSRKSILSKRLLPILSIAWLVSAACFLSFCVSQHVFTVSDTLNASEPDLNSANAVARTIPGRTVSLATIRDGSFMDFPMYGVPQKTLELGWAIASRFLADGTASVGMYRRFGVGSIITAPNWTTENPGTIPNVAAIMRSSPLLRSVFDSRSNVSVFRLREPRSFVTPTEVACVRGGPGLLDYMFAFHEGDGLSIKSDATNCARYVYLNYDYKDASMLKIPGSVVLGGQTLFPNVGILRDADYAFEGNRELVNVKWYRDSLDGDSTVISHRSVALLTSDDSTIVALANPHPRNISVMLHLAVHSNARVTVRAVDASNLPYSPLNQETETAVLTPRSGFQWITLHPNVPRNVKAGLQISFSDIQQGTVLNWAGVAIDGVVIAPSHAGHLRPPVFAGASLIAESADHMPIPYQREPPPAILFPSPLIRNERLDGMRGESYNGTSFLLPQRQFSRATFPWTGPGGDYTITAVALLQAGDVLSLEAGGSKAIATRHSADATGTTVLLNAHLSRGEPIVVGLLLNTFTNGSGVHLSNVSVAPRTGHMSTDADAHGNEHAFISLTDALDDYRHIAKSAGVSRASDGITAASGGHLNLEARFQLHPAVAVVRISSKGDGGALASVDCGGGAVQATVTSPEATVVVPGPITSVCHLKIAWPSAGLTVTRVQIDTVSSRVIRRERIWIPKGLFTLHAYDRNGSENTSNVTTVEGAPRTGNVLKIASAGYYWLQTDSAGDHNAFLALAPVARSALAGNLTFRQTGETQWDVSVKRPTSLELAEFSDGNWVLRARDGTGEIRGSKCDVMNTCFENAPRGEYTIFHEWPKKLAFGLALSLSIVLLAILLVLIKGGEQRRPVA